MQVKTSNQDTSNPNSELVLAPKRERGAMGHLKVKRMVAEESRTRILKAQAEFNGLEVAPVQVLVDCVESMGITEGNVPNKG